MGLVEWPRESWEGFMQRGAPISVGTMRKVVWDELEGPGRLLDPSEPPGSPVLLGTSSLEPSRGG